MLCVLIFREDNLLIQRRSGTKRVFVQV